MSNNIKIANEDSLKMKSLMKDTGVWTSDNLGDMPRSERRAILKVYAKHFNIVEYMPASGVCKCTNGPSTMQDDDGNFLICSDNGGTYGRAVKKENMPDMTNSDVFVTKTLNDAIDIFR